MKRRFQMLAGVTLIMGSYNLAQASAGNESNAPTSFAIARIQFEHNATDGDFEVVFEALGGSEGLAKLSVVAPDGRTIIDFTAPEASVLGIRQFRFESPEPKDVASLKAAYPAGIYTFSGTTASGLKLQSTPVLNHTLPAAASFLHPKAEAEGVAVKNLEITWTPVKNAVAYNVYIEQDELGVNVTARLPGSATMFDVPDGFLLPDTEYTLGIGAETAEGNASYLETSFTTAGKK